MQGNMPYECKAVQGSAAYGQYNFEMKRLSAEGVFAGYASVFGVVDSQGDRVLPGAFAQSLKERKAAVQLLWQHQWEHPIGVIHKLFEDRRGLYLEGRLLMDVAKAREAYSLLKERVVRGLSIGYRVKQARVNERTGVRDLQAVELFEISLVTLPANEAAQVTVVKSVDADMAALVRAMEQARHALLY